MFTARSIHRPAVLCALAFALLGSALTGTAAAEPANDTRTAAAIAQESYYSSYGKPVTIDARTATAQAQAQARYYSSYGEPEPLALPQPAAPSDQTPWRAIALAIPAALAIIAVSATQLRRFWIRRRGARALA